MDVPSSTTSATASCNFSRLPASLVSAIACHPSSAGIQSNASTRFASRNCLRRAFSEDGAALAARGDVWRCVQHAGDMVVLPEGWAHATLNLRTSVGIAREFVPRPNNCDGPCFP